MLRKFVAVLALCLISSAVMAEKWSAIGILTTQVKGEPATVQYVEIDDFDSAEKCEAVVKRESYSEDYIGVGGTNHKLPSVQWNFDANCIMKRSD